MKNCKETLHFQKWLSISCLTNHSPDILSDTLNIINAPLNCITYWKTNYHISHIVLLGLNSQEIFMTVNPKCQYTNVFFILICVLYYICWWLYHKQKVTPVIKHYIVYNFNSWLTAPLCTESRGWSSFRFNISLSFRWVRCTWTNHFFIALFCVQNENPVMTRVAPKVMMMSQEAK